MNKNIAIAIAVVVVVLGVGYWMYMGPEAAPSQTGATPTPATSGTPAAGTPAAGAPVYNSTTQPAAFAARATLAAKLGVNAATIAIVQIDEKKWEDGCLGRRNAGESCTEGSVEGYQISLQAKNEVYLYRTNKTGSIVRAEAN